MEYCHQQNPEVSSHLSSYKQAVQMRDNREVRGRQRELISQVRAGTRFPAQLTTDIKYKQGNIHYWTGGVGHANQTVGVEMEAYLDPADPKTGSRTAAGTGIYANGLYPNIVQGHLLNANLGGQAIAENLFPITTGMNRAHSTQVEDFVKAELLKIHQNSADPALGWDHRRLYYHVTVNNANLGVITPATLRGTVFNITSYVTDNNNPNGDGGVNPDYTQGGMNNKQLATPGPNLNDQLADIGFAPAAAPTYTLGLQHADPAGQHYCFLKNGAGIEDHSLKVLLP